MSAKFIEVTGRNEEEAIEKALSQLGLSRDNVSVELLERAKSGFFGIGAKPAKIRVTYGLDDEEIPAAPTPKASKPAAPAKPVQSEKQPRQQAPVPVKEKPEMPAQEKAERPQKITKPHPQRKSIESREPRPAAVETSLPPVQAEDLGEPCHDEKAQQIETFLTGLLRHMGSDATVKVYLPEEGRYKVILEGEKLGQLIGRRGETLDAIQQITSYSVNRGSDKRVRIHVDAENYRLKREQSLQHLALKVAAKVAKYRRNVTLEPMNAYERHVIHTALQGVENITTYSMGTEPNRRVIIAYDRGNKSK